MEGVLETAAAGIGAAFGTGAVSPTLAASLRSLLPEALFLRASLRCGAGLFVSDDLLQPGQNELSVVSLKNSLAGLAMAQQQPVVVATPAATAAPSAAQVVCVPVALSPTDASAAAAQAAVFTAAQAAAGGASPAASSRQADAAAGRPVYVGALMLGSAHPGSLPAQLSQALQSLAAAAAPYLLLLGLTKAADMEDLLRLRAADCICCGGEEDELQDLPLEACRPQLSPRSSGGSAGGAASPFAGSAASDDGSPAVELDEAALNAAAAKALAGASNLEMPPRTETAAAGAGGEGSSRGQRVAAPALRQRGPQKQQQQGKLAAGAESEAEADPKAALRQLLAAAAGEAPAPQHVPTNPLLSFTDAELEARFATAHNRAQVRGDALFCVLHLAGALTLALLGPAGLPASGAAVALTFALALPLLTMTVDRDRYLRHRETMLSLALLLHACLLRGTAAAALQRLPPAGLLGYLPWLLRATGAEALAVFTIGFKLRFRRILPLHILCLALVMGGLPPRCGTGPAEGCLPASLHRAAVAVLLALGSLLPAVAVYKTEDQARRRFLAASTTLLGLPRQPQAAAVE